MRRAAVLLLCACTSAASSPDGALAPDGGVLAPDSGVLVDSGAAADSAPAPDGGSMMSGTSADECFAGLRPLKGANQDATRASADGKYKMRLALETADRGGTSGSYAWAAIRFALETPDGNVCITDEAALATAYMGSHHNCMDVITVTAGARRYVIQNPDSAIDYVDHTKFRRDATLTITGGMMAGPFTLLTTKCTPTACISGGPCQ